VITLCKNPAGDVTIPANSCMPQSPTNQAAVDAKPALRDVAGVFLRAGSLTFGGGTTTTAALQREIVKRRGWLDDTQFGLIYGLSRLTPGTNLIAFSTAAGWSVAGWAGAIMALLGISVPGSALAVLLTWGYDSWGRSALALSAMRGGLAAAVGMLVAASWDLIRPYMTPRKRMRTVVIVTASVAMSAGLQISPVPVLALAALVGLIWRVQEAA
jgi:chromate transporter